MAIRFCRSEQPIRHRSLLCLAEPSPVRSAIVPLVVRRTSKVLQLKSRRLRIEPLEERRMLAQILRAATRKTSTHGPANMAIFGTLVAQDYVVPPERLNGSFFDVFFWQARVPGSPIDGNLSSTSMSFFDEAGPNGADIVVGGYHWPKGVQGMDRHTGEVFHRGNPDGGETIGVNTPAFSNDGSVIYVTNDATFPPTSADGVLDGGRAWHVLAQWRRCESRFDRRVFAQGLARW